MAMIMAMIMTMIMAMIMAAMIMAMIMAMAVRIAEGGSKGGVWWGRDPPPAFPTGSLLDSNVTYERTDLASLGPRFARRRRSLTFVATPLSYVRRDGVI